MVERGFTLIELMVVLAIMAMIVSIAPSAINKSREYYVYQQVLNSMQSDIKSARYLAMIEGREVIFSVDFDKKKFGYIENNLHEIPPSLTIRTTVADKELTSDGVASIRFLPEGGATGGRIDVIRPTYSGTTLKIDWLTGRIFQSTFQP